MKTRMLVAAALPVIVFAAALGVSGGAAAVAPGAAEAGGFSRVSRERLVDLVDTRFEVTLDFDKKSIAGTSTVTVRGLEKAAEHVVLDAVEMTILAVTDAATGAALPFDHDGTLLDVRLGAPLALGAARTVVVTYRATPKRGLTFVAASPRVPKGHREAWTQGEETDTRAWLPTIDRLDDFGTSEGIIRVPAGLSVLSNGALVEHRRDGDQELWHWRQDKPHAGYLIFLAAGVFERRERSWRGLPVTFWFDKRSEERVARTFDITLPALDFFKDQLGLDYPWAKFDQITVTDFPFGGMENTSAVLLTNAALHDARAEPDYSSQDLVVHELAHQWFGDLVTCRDWAHIWLNEGFASYMEMVFREHRDGWEAAIARFFEALGGAMAEARGEGARPIVLRTYASPGDMFDGTTYGKGAWVLHALRGWVGDDRAFFAIFGEWTRRFAHQSVETSQFRRVAEDVTGLDLRRFFEQWTERPGFPALAVDYTWSAEEGALHLTVRQTQATDAGVPLFRLPVDLRLARGGRELMRRRVWTETASVELVLPLAERPDVVEVDPRAWLPAEVVVAWTREDALAALASGSTVVTRRRAIDRLGELGLDAATATTLLEAAPKASYFEAEAMVRAASSAAAEVGVPLLLALGKHAESRARAAAVRALGNVTVSEPVKAAVLRGMDDPSYRVVAAAAGALPKVDKPDAALDRLAAAARLDTPRDVVRSAVMAAMGRVGGKRALTLLAPFTEDRERAPVRVAALTAMGRAAASEPALVASTFDALSRRLGAPDAVERKGAVAGLEALGDARALPRLRELGASDPDEDVRDRATRAAARLERGSADAKRLTALEKSLEEAQTERERLRLQVEGLERRVEALSGRR